MAFASERCFYLPVRAQLSGAHFDHLHVRLSDARASRESS
jgi:hypothetical protein